MHWSLLGIGITQAPIWVAAIVVGWLLALGWRERHGAALGDNRFNLVQVGLALWTAAALSGLFISIERGLLGPPEMQISGNGSTAKRSAGTTIGRRRAAANLGDLGSARGLPIAMLAWALWIASALLWWLRWGFGAFATEGSGVLRRALEAARKPRHHPRPPAR